jgi:hypothetical protein
VVFLFKQISRTSLPGNLYIEGFWLDNFLVKGYKVNLTAQDTTFSTINSSALQPGATISYTVSNTGQSNGSVTTTKFYWSLDSILNASDSSVYQISIPAIAHGTSSSFNATVPFPQNLNQDSLYLFYKVDANNNVVETNENDNLGKLKILLSPFVNYQLKTTIDTIFTSTNNITDSVHYKIKNIGTIAGTTTTITKLYWSIDSILDNTDVEIASKIEPSISNNDSIVSSTLIQYPQPINQEFYYIFYNSDATNAIQESSELDNVFMNRVFFTNYSSLKPNEVSGIKLFYSNEKLFIATNEIDTKAHYNFIFYDMYGQEVFNKNLVIEPGVTEVVLPKGLPKSMYTYSLICGKKIIRNKIIIR